MHNDKIKAIVLKINSLISGDSLDHSEIMIDMCRDMGKSPTLAVALIQYLKASGYDLLSLKGEEAEAFKNQFNPHLEKLNEDELKKLNGITERLFR